MAPNCVRIRSTSLFCLVPFTKLLEDLYFSFWGFGSGKKLLFLIFSWILLDTYLHVRVEEMVNVRG